MRGKLNEGHKVRLGQRRDPYSNFTFLVEIEGLVVGGFSEVLGLQAETEFEEIREGGVNDHVHRFPKLTKYPNLVLKRGITDSDILLKWYQNAVEGKVQRKSVFIMLLDTKGEEKWRWNFANAYPVKWIGPDFKSDGNSAALEALELVHDGMRKI
jgi:phage tail-like protein